MSPTVGRRAGGPRRARAARTQRGEPTSRARPARLAAGRAARALRALPPELVFTHLDKLLYPEQGLTKADLIAYYALVAERMLPHVAGRPLALLRCPDGRQRHCFYQKHARPGVPEVVARVEIAEADGSLESYMTIQDLSGLLALVQLGALEIHTWAGRADALERPDQLVFDLDPDVDLGWERVAEGARELRRRLADLGLESFVKTTGGKGLHVVLPVQRRLSWEEHREFARGLVAGLEREQPARYTANPRKQQREGRIFLDYLRNGRGATAIAPYSTRALAGAPVATPLAWSELERPLDASAFTVHTLPRRLDRMKRDPWDGYADLRQSICRGAQSATASARRARPDSETLRSGERRRRGRPGPQRSRS